ncbi:MAG TPA: oxalate/formate MFS antiporter [Thermodesulfobacteriota bacterium]|nr:oxalate/formate MFS antiporter [Thermodesulfobacteriota bacterium]
MPNEGMVQTDIAKQLYGPIAGNRWVQLIAGVIAMIVISNYQYAFTLFTPGMRQQFTGVPYAQIALIFSMFILFETWPVPVAGYFVDRFGIRKLMILGSIGILVGWFLGGTVAKSVSDLYIYYGVIAGTGAGIIYISTVANAVKWFPDRRGLAAGLTAAGFGGGAAITIMPIAATISSMGWAGAMATWGLAQGIVAFIMALILRHPPKGWAPPGWDQKALKVTKAVAQSKVEYTWTQTIRRPEFYLLYAMFLFVCSGGLMTTGNLSQIAKSLNVADAKIWGMAIIPFTATLTGITNAFSRIMWGSISDKMGREYTMTLAFALEGFLIFMMTQIAGNSIAFVILLPFVFLSWGEIYALFSAITGDIFGPKNASANYGILYTAKGAASILAGYGAALLAAYFAGSFTVPYYIAAAFDITAAILAFFALRPLVRGRIAKEVPKAAEALKPA